MINQLRKIVESISQIRHMLQVKIDFSLKFFVIFPLTTCWRFCQQAQILWTPFGHETFSTFWRGTNNALQFKKDHRCLQKTFSSQQIKEELFQQSLILAALGYFNCCFCLSKKGRKVTHQTGHLEWSHELSKNSNVNDLFSGRGGVLLTVL